MIYGGIDNSLEDLYLYVYRTVLALKSHADDYDFLACCGMSGVVVAAPASLQLHKPVVIVRKDEDKNYHHRGGTLISSESARGRYLIVDDFVSSGRTLEFIKAKLSCVLGEYDWRIGDCLPIDDQPVYAGYFMYSHGEINIRDAKELKAAEQAAAELRANERLNPPPPALNLDSYKPVRESFDFRDLAKYTLSYDATPILLCNTN